MEKGYRIVSSRSFEDYEKLIADLFSVDRICYGEIPEEDQGVPEYWISIRNASHMQVLLFEGKVVGARNFIRIANEGVRELLAGKLRDGELAKYADTRDPGKEANLLSVSTVVLPEHRGKGLAKKLWNACREDFISKGIFIRSAYCTVWTEAGRKYLGPLNPEIVAHDMHGHDIVSIPCENGTLPEYK